MLERKFYNIVVHKVYKYYIELQNSVYRICIMSPLPVQGYTSCRRPSSFVYGYFTLEHIYNTCCIKRIKKLLYQNAYMMTKCLHDAV